MTIRFHLAALSAAGLMLGGCVSGGDEPVETPVAQCDAAPAQSLVGQPYSDALGEQARASANASEVRRLAPDTVTTMEFNGARLNVVVDAANVVTEVRCG